MSEKKNPRKALNLGLASALGLSSVLTLGLTSVSAAEDTALFQQALGQEVLSDSMKQAEGEITAFVQFKGTGAFGSTQPDAVREGEQDPVDAKPQVDAIARSVERQGDRLADITDAEVVYTTHNSVRGVAIRGDAEKIRELAARGEIEKITPVVAKYPMKPAANPLNGGTTIDTDTLATWQQTGYTGEGKKIAIIDSGVDYTHAQFGGPGTQEAYDRAKAMTEMPDANSGLYDPDKYLGGYDLVGDAYNPNKGLNQPQPDTNPLDCRDQGHGSHVAGTVAGYAVQADGSTFKGDYTKLSAEEVRQMKIGAGSAPGAQIIDFRVFGCEGATEVTGQALDRALDPNQDGKFDDRADVVNMSLGTDFGAQDDPENAIVDELTKQGVLSVVAAGNSQSADGNGDTYSVSGNPANSVSALAVANSIGSTTYVDLAKVTGPAAVAGDVRGSYSVRYDYTSAKPEDLRGQVVMAPADNRFGCDAFPDGTDFAGKWVFIEWTDKTDGTFPCGSGQRFDNLAKAGAKGVVLSSMEEFDEIGISGNTAIPGIRLSKSDSDKLRPYAEAGTLEIELSQQMRSRGVLGVSTLDQLNTSSGRGVHGSNGLTKPDVAAPGTNIGSALVGTGSEKAVFTGTSMATPHVAGVAALVAQANPDYSASQLKAAIMNSAVHDLTDDQGAVHSVERTGSGRVDALRAVKQRVLAYNAETPSQVSETFGVLEYLPTQGVQTLTKDITLENNDSKAHTYQVSFQASSDIPGVEISAPQSVTVPAGGKTTVTVTATVDPSKLAKVLDPAQAETQLGGLYRQYISIESGRLRLIEGDQELRLPLQIAPKPASDLKAEKQQVTFEPGASSAELKMTGTNLKQGGYTSLLGAFELGASSDRIARDQLSSQITSPSVDIQHVGAASNLPALKAAGGDIDAEGKIFFGVSTWATWETLTGTAGINVALDVNNDGEIDYWIYTARLKGFDHPVVNLSAIQQDGSLKLLDVQSLNGITGYLDTNTMDSNAMVLPVSWSALGLSETEAANLRYQVFSFSFYEDGQAVDGISDWIGFNPVAPKLWFEGQATDSPALFLDSTEAPLTVHRASAQDTESKVLLLHMHNLTGDLSGKVEGEDGGRAEVLPLVEEKATPEPTASPEPTVSPEPTQSPDPSASPEPSASAEPTASPEPSASATAAPTMSPEPSASAQPTASASAEPSAQPTMVSPSAVPSSSASAPVQPPAPSVSPSQGMAPAPSASASAKATVKGESARTGAEAGNQGLPLAWLAAGALLLAGGLAAGYAYLARSRKG